MNAIHARRWLKAAAACDPEGSYSGPLALVEAHAKENCAWEGAVSGGGSAVRLLAVPSNAAGRLDAAWDPGKAAWLFQRAGAPKGKLVPFRAKDFAAPVDEALARFHRLNPIASVRRDGARWTLILERPLAWPLFLRCDLSAAFAPRASQLSLLLRDSRIVALDFDGEALWARFSA